MNRDFFFFVFPSVFRGILSIFLVPVVTYYLDPDDFGIAAIIFVLTGWIDTIATAGSGWVLSAKFFKIGKEDRRELVTTLLLADMALRGFAVGGLFFASSALLPLFIKNYQPEFGYYLNWALLKSFISSIWPIISCILIYETKAKQHALLEMLRTVSGMVVTLSCLVIFKLDVITLFMAPLVSEFLTVLLGLFFLRRFVQFKISKKYLKDIVHIGLPTIPTNFFDAVSNTIDRVFIERWLNFSQLGIYSHSRNYHGLFSSANKAFIRVMSPITLDIFSNNGDIRQIERDFTVWYGVTGIAGLFVTFFSLEAIHILTHGKFDDAAPLLPIWFLFTFTVTFGGTYTKYILVVERPKLILYSQIVVNVVMLPLSALCVYYFGTIGACMSVLVINAAFQFALRHFALKLGCPKFAEWQCFQITIILLAVYIFNQIYELDLLTKVVCVLVGGLLITKLYDLGQLPAFISDKLNAFLPKKE